MDLIKSYCEKFTQVIYQHLQQEIDNSEDIGEILKQFISIFETLTTSLYVEDYVFCRELCQLCHTLFLYAAKMVLSTDWFNLEVNDEHRIQFLASADKLHYVIRDLYGLNYFLVLIHLADNPWSHPILLRILIGDHTVEPKQVEDYLCHQMNGIIEMRIQLLYESGATEMVVNLCNRCLAHKRYRDNDYIRMFLLISLYSEKNEDLLHSECWKVPCHQAVRLIQGFLQQKNPKYTGLCAKLSQIFLLQDWLKPKDYCCTKTLLMLWLRLQFEEDMRDCRGDQFVFGIRKVAEAARNGTQIIWLIDAICKLFEDPSGKLTKSGALTSFYISPSNDTFNSIEYLYQGHLSQKLTTCDNDQENVCSLKQKTVRKKKYKSAAVFTQAVLKGASSDNITLKNESGQFACDKCEKYFKRKYPFLEHYGTHHNGVKYFKCNDCDKSFGYIKSLRKHQTDKCKKIQKQENATDTFCNSAVYRTSTNSTCEHERISPETVETETVQSSSPGAKAEESKKKCVDVDNSELTKVDGDACSSIRIESDIIAEPPHPNLFEFCSQVLDNSTGKLLKAENSKESVANNLNDVNTCSSPLTQYQRDIKNQLAVEAASDDSDSSVVLLSDYDDWSTKDKLEKQISTDFDDVDGRNCPPCLAVPQSITPVLQSPSESTDGASDSEIYEMNHQLPRVDLCSSPCRSPHSPSVGVYNCKEQNVKLKEEGTKAVSVSEMFDSAIVKYVEEFSLVEAPCLSPKVLDQAHVKDPDFATPPTSLLSPNVRTGVSSSLEEVKNDVFLTNNEKAPDKLSNTINVSNSTECEKTLKSNEILSEEITTTQKTCFKCPPDVERKILKSGVVPSDSTASSIVDLSCNDVEPQSKSSLHRPSQLPQTESECEREAMSKIESHISDKEFVVIDEDIEEKCSTFITREENEMLPVKTPKTHCVNEESPVCIVGRDTDLLSQSYNSASEMSEEEVCSLFTDEKRNGFTKDLTDIHNSDDDNVINNCDDIKIDDAMIGKYLESFNSTYPSFKLEDFLPMKTHKDWISYHSKQDSEDAESILANVASTFDTDQRTSSHEIPILESGELKPLKQNFLETHARTLPEEVVHLESSDIHVIIDQNESKHLPYEQNKKLECELCDEIYLESKKEVFISDGSKSPSNCRIKEMETVEDNNMSDRDYIKRLIIDTIMKTLLNTKTIDNSLEHQSNSDIEEVELDGTTIINDESLLSPPHYYKTVSGTSADKADECKSPFFLSDKGPLSTSADITDQQKSSSIQYEKFGSDTLVNVVNNYEWNSIHFESSKVCPCTPEITEVVDYIDASSISSYVKDEYGVENAILGVQSIPNPSDLNTLVSDSRPNLTHSGHCLVKDDAPPYKMRGNEKINTSKIVDEKPLPDNLSAPINEKINELEKENLEKNVTFYETDYDVRIGLIQLINEWRHESFNLDLPWEVLLSHCLLYMRCHNIFYEYTHSCFVDMKWKKPLLKMFKLDLPQTVSEVDTLSDGSDSDESFMLDENIDVSDSEVLKITRPQVARHRKPAQDSVSQNLMGSFEIPSSSISGSSDSTFTALMCLIPSGNAPVDLNIQSTVLSPEAVQQSFIDSGRQGSSVQLVTISGISQDSVAGLFRGILQRMLVNETSVSSDSKTDLTASKNLSQDAVSSNVTAAPASGGTGLNISSTLAQQEYLPTINQPKGGINLSESICLNNTNAISSSAISDEKLSHTAVKSYRLCDLKKVYRRGFKFVLATSRGGKVILPYKESTSEDSDTGTRSRLRPRIRRHRKKMLLESNNGSDADDEDLENQIRSKLGRRGSSKSNTFLGDDYDSGSWYDDEDNININRSKIRRKKLQRSHSYAADYVGDHSEISEDSEYQSHLSHKRKASKQSEELDPDYVDYHEKIKTINRTKSNTKVSRSVRHEFSSNSKTEKYLNMLAKRKQELLQKKLKLKKTEGKVNSTVDHSGSEKWHWSNKSVSKKYVNSGTINYDTDHSLEQGEVRNSSDVHVGKIYLDGNDIRKKLRAKRKMSLKELSYSSEDSDEDHVKYQSKVSKPRSPKKKAHSEQENSSKAKCRKILKEKMATQEESRQETSHSYDANIAKLSSLETKSPKKSTDIENVTSSNTTTVLMAKMQAEERDNREAGKKGVMRKKKMLDKEAQRRQLLYQRRREWKCRKKLHEKKSQLCKANDREHNTVERILSIKKSRSLKYGGSKQHSRKHLPNFAHNTVQQTPYQWPSDKPLAKNPMVLYLELNFKRIQSQNPHVEKTSTITRTLIDEWIRLTDTERELYNQELARLRKKRKLEQEKHQRTLLSAVSDRSDNGANASDKSKDSMVKKLIDTVGKQNPKLVGSEHASLDGNRTKEKNEKKDDRCVTKVKGKQTVKDELKNTDHSREKKSNKKRQHDVKNGVDAKSKKTKIEKIPSKERKISSDVNGSHKSVRRNHDEKQPSSAGSNAQELMAHVSSKTADFKGTAVCLPMEDDDYFQSSPLPSSPPCTQVTQQVIKSSCCADTSSVQKLTSLPQVRPPSIMLDPDVEWDDTMPSIVLQDISLPTKPFSPSKIEKKQKIMSDKSTAEISQSAIKDEKKQKIMSDKSATVKTTQPGKECEKKQKLPSDKSTSARTTQPAKEDEKKQKLPSDKSTSAKTIQPAKEDAEKQNLPSDKSTSAKTTQPAKEDEKKQKLLSDKSTSAKTTQPAKEDDKKQKLLSDQSTSAKTTQPAKEDEKKRKLPSDKSISAKITQPAKEDEKEQKLPSDRSTSAKTTQSAKEDETKLPSDESTSAQTAQPAKDDSNAISVTKNQTPAYSLSEDNNKSNTTNVSAESDATGESANALISNNTSKINDLTKPLDIEISLDDSLCRNVGDLKNSQHKEEKLTPRGDDRSRKRSDSPRRPLTPSSADRQGLFETFSSENITPVEKIDNAEEEKNPTDLESKLLKSLKTVVTKTFQEKKVEHCENTACIQRINNTVDVEKQSTDIKNVEKTSKIETCEKEIPDKEEIATSQECKNLGLDESKTSGLKFFKSSPLEKSKRAQTHCSNNLDSISYSSKKECSKAKEKNVQNLKVTERVKKPYKPSDSTINSGVVCDNSKFKELMGYRPAKTYSRKLLCDGCKCMILSNELTKHHMSCDLYANKHRPKSLNVESFNNPTTESEDTLSKSMTPDWLAVAEKKREATSTPTILVSDDSDIENPLLAAADDQKNERLKRSTDDNEDIYPSKILRTDSGNETSLLTNKVIQDVKGGGDNSLNKSPSNPGRNDFEKSFLDFTSAKQAKIQAVYGSATNCKQEQRTTCTKKTIEKRTSNADILPSKSANVEEKGKTPVTVPVKVNPYLKRLGLTVSPSSTVEEGRRSRTRTNSNSERFRKERRLSLPDTVLTKKVQNNGKPRGKKATVNKNETEIQEREEPKVSSSKAPTTRTERELKRLGVTELSVAIMKGTAGSPLKMLPCPTCGLEFNKRALTGHKKHCKKKL